VSRLFRSVLIGATALATLAGCATDQGVRTVGQRPEALDTTEASLWYQMDQMEESLLTSGRLLEDPALNAYVTELVCRIGGEYCADIRVYVLDSIDFNAMMAPNGMMLVNSGLLLRASSEDELAFVLGHEMAHFVENHALEQRNANRNAAVTAAIVGSVISVGVAASTGVAPGQGYSGTSGSIATALAYGGAFSYSREREAEADRIGVELIAEAGLDPTAAPRIWTNLLDELKASDDERRARRADRGGMYRTHPLIQQRIDTLTEQTASMAMTEPRTAELDAVVSPHLKDWLDAQIALRDYGSSLFLIDRRLETGGHEGILHAARGRVLAMRGEEGDREAALNAYQAATQYDDVPADTYRLMGEAYRQAGEPAAAATAFTTYLELDPNARDARLVERLIETLSGENS